MTRQLHQIQKRQYKFWKGIWGERVHHNEQTEWIGRVEDKLKGVKREKVKITEESFMNWKGAGPDGIQGYWLKS